MNTIKTFFRHSRTATAFLFMALLTVFPLAGQENSRKTIREGNKLYEAGEHIEAENTYRRALEADHSSQTALFNLGNALYRQDKFDEAGKEFEAALDQMSDKKDRAKAYHNLGNALLKQQKVKESVDAYKQALRNNPNDLETKQNLSYAMRLLQQQEQQQQNQDNPPEEEDEIKKQAEKLVAQRKYQEAYNLMKEGEKRNKNLLKYADFTNRILDIIKMN